MESPAPQRLADVLEQATGQSGTITVGDAAALTWLELRRLSAGLAHTLRDLGLAAGGRIAVLDSTTLESVIAVQAAWLASCSVTLLQPPIRGEDAVEFSHRIIAQCRSIQIGALLVGSVYDSVKPLLTDAARIVADLQIGDSAQDVPPVQRGLDDDVIVQFTSGTSAQPRAVRITERNLLSQLEALKERSNHQAMHDVMVSWLPLYHDMGLIGFLALPMSCGGCQLHLTSPEAFVIRPASWLENLSRLNATATAAPNFAFSIGTRVLDGNATFDLSRLGFLLSGGEPISAATVRAFLEAGARHGLDPSAFCAAYGMAEATLGVAFARQGTGLQTDLVERASLEALGTVRPADGDEDAVELVALGSALTGLELRIVRSDDRPAAENEIGEIQTRGTSVTPGYVSGDDFPCDSEGWLKTGDLGYLGARGLVIVGRKKDLIIAGGRNIYPEDIERVVATVQGVRPGNVIAFQLDATAAVGSGLVVLAESPLSDQSDQSDLADQIRRAVTSGCGVRPHDIRILAPGEIPKTASGKLRRNAAKKQYQAADEIR